jgi:hypothetical protein
MSDDLTDVRKALHEHRRDERRASESLAALHAAIVAALSRGVRQGEIVRTTGYTRERIRQISIAARRPAE